MYFSDDFCSAPRDISIDVSVSEQISYDASLKEGRGVTGTKATALVVSTTSDR